MKTNIHIIQSIVLSALALLPSAGFGQSQNVSFIDPGLDAAIRDALQKPNGPLTAADLLNLTDLDAENRNITNAQGLELARNLKSLDLENNKLTDFALPATLTNLTFLDLGFNVLKQCSLPNGFTNLDTLILTGNQLTNIILPSGLTALSDLDLEANQLSQLALPSDVTNLTLFFVLGNPLRSLILSEPIAAGNLAEEIVSLQTQGVAVLTFPLTAQLVSPRQTATGQFEFALVGPPGVYALQTSSDFKSWTEIALLTNATGTVRFEDFATNVVQQKFYRAGLRPD